MAPDPHTAVRRELLVRYLDFWVPASLHPGRGATYLDRSGYGPPAALRVMGEFADLIVGRGLRVLVDGTLPADPGIEGLRLARLPADPAAEVRAAGRTPVLAHLDGPPGDPLRDALGAAPDGELLVATPPAAAGEDPRADLHTAGFRYVVAVELVDGAGAVVLLRFATSTARSLERFKDELWAVDRYAGVWYREPGESDAVPLDISDQPHPGPLRRALLAVLSGGGPHSVDELREYAQTRTVYRPADVPRALSALIARGAVAREPERGRLTGATQVRLTG